MTLKKTRLAVYIKLSVSNSIFLFAANCILVTIQIVCNMLLKTTFLIDYNQFKLNYVISLSLLISLTTLSNYFYTTKAIRIEEKNMDEARILHAMEEMKWKVKEQNESSIIFTAPFNTGIWNERMTIRYTDFEIIITGPKQYLGILISNAKFTYGAYEIINPQMVNNN